MRQILSGVLVVGMGLVPVTVPLMVQQSWAQTQELQAEWEALVDQAIQQTRIGQYRQAIETWQQVLDLARQLNDRQLEALAMLGIGFNYEQLDQYQKALDYYNQALPIFQEVGDQASVATTLNNIGRVYHAIGQPQKALESYNQALPIRQEVGDRAGVATTFNNIGVVYRAMGQPQKALESYNQALPIHREMGDRAGVASTLNNIGGVYHAIGQPQKALESYNQALPIFQQVGDRAGVATTLNNIGAVYRAMGQPQKALESYNQALPISHEVGDRAGVAITLHNIGAVYNDIGQPQKALESYNQALPILREVGNRAGVAATLNNIGAVYDAIGQPQKALESYNQALPISREVGNRTGVATTLSSIGAVYRAIGQPQKALDYYNQAVTITLEMRQGLQRGNRQSFLGNEPGSVIALTNLLIDQNQPKQAFEWINLYSTAELADYTRLIDAQVSNPQAQKSLDQWNQKNQQLEIFRQQLQENFSEERSRQFREFEAQVNQEAEDISRQYPEVAELLETTPDDLEQLQSSIPDGTVVIQPVLLTNIKDVPNNIAIFILTKDQPITVKKVPVDPDQLDNLITDYREIVQNRYATGFRDRGSELYDLLIRPIEDQIQSFSPSKIAIIATGKLRYIPFETLYNRDTGKFLIETYPINYFTRLSVNSLQLTDIGNSPSLQHGALGLGNPIPEEPYNLPGAEAEIKNLPNLLPRSEIYLGNDATVERFKYHAPRFPVIHLATHGCFQAEGCCLGEKEDCNGVRRIDMEPNTLLFADEPFNIANAARLGMKNTELLVLSACQTALREESDGREIAGIAYLFERAGAKAVMASLWNAEDETTSEIMTQFYQNLNQGMSKGEALRQAKLQQIDRHPFYWSPFILIGNAQ
ncbi:MAG: CHAT domain-containing tetratricopeptide repeat protein [Coleofasciculus sp. C1-SOL-03]|uniref:tetratricopeptide repeat protein n=1 Tax=Coleofasciculus sp. C1-SOL-03 TaxID=3069522 RepID=UPI0032FDA66D